MPNNAMPYDNIQSPAIPKQENASANPGQGKTPQKNDHPNQIDKGNGAKQAFENEGEGSKSAARNYADATSKYIQSGRVEGAAKNAEEALEGPGGAKLRAAELEARAGEPDAKTDNDSE